MPASATLAPRRLGGAPDGGAGRPRPRRTRAGPRGSPNAVCVDGGLPLRSSSPSYLTETLSARCDPCMAFWNRSGNWGPTSSVALPLPPLGAGAVAGGPGPSIGAWDRGESPVADGCSSGGYHWPSLAIHQPGPSGLSLIRLPPLLCVVNRMDK